MKRIHVLAAVVALGLAVLTGSAVAGGGNGNGGGGGGSSASAPGQEKQDDAAAQPTQPAPAQQVQAPTKSSGKSSSAPGQTKKSSSSTKQSTHTSSHGVNSTTAGVKPSSATNAVKPTKCFTGAGATCGPGSQPDNSKRYGNGKTAAQIATSRGAPSGTEIRGPGNSQPHKVCKNGHWVDVHAVKTGQYPTAGCETTQPQGQPTQQTLQQSGCPPATTVQTTQVFGIWHLNGKGEKVHLMTNPKSAHFRGKHGDHETESVTVTKTIVGSGSCAEQQVLAQQPTQPTAITPAAPTGAVAGVTPAAAPTAVAAAPQPSAGGVLGAQATVKSKAKPARGGVLGAAGRIAGASLPFTGLPLWGFVLAAAVLLTGGLLVRRLARASRRA